jgi:hypothetical protein
VRQSTMQHLQLTLQANDLVLESLTAQPFTFELLDGLAQRMNLGGPSILVSSLPRFRTFSSRQCSIALFPDSGPTLLCNLQALLQAGQRGRIGQRLAQPATGRGEARRFADNAVSLAQNCSQCTSRYRETGAAHRFGGLLDLLVRQFPVHAIRSCTWYSRVTCSP